MEEPYQWVGNYYRQNNCSNKRNGNSIYLNQDSSLAPMMSCGTAKNVFFMNISFLILLLLKFRNPSYLHTNIVWKSTLIINQMLLRIHWLNFTLIRYTFSKKSRICLFNMYVYILLLFGLANKKDNCAFCKSWFAPPPHTLENLYCILEGCRLVSSDNVFKTELHFP